MGTITLYIEDKPYQVKPGGNLLHACLTLGFDVPYFCWHPAMHSVGACRQCAVKEFKDEKDTRGRIVMSCMTPVRDGMRISIEDPEAKSFRKSIIELLMLNHPHDCPVCDEGGECHLQDMTVMTGHAYRRTRFKKRTYPNQYLGPFLTHELNRCIQCYRCVRFYRDYAGGRDLDVFAAHDSVYFGRQKDGVLENEFSGNLAEICPTGVFTDKSFQKHYTRKWDLRTAPSVCVHCGIGCNTIPGERYGDLRRIRCRYNGEVNRYVLCDRGRYGYEFVNSEKRIRGPRVDADPVSKDKAMDRIKDILSGSKGVIGIGSPRATLESNFALRTLVGPENFYAGMSGSDTRLAGLVCDVLAKGPARSPSLREVESCDAILVLGEDVTNTGPVLALAMRQASRSNAVQTAAGQHIPPWDDAAVRNATRHVRPRFFSATPYRARLDEVASRTYYAAPDDIARLGFAVAHALNNDLPAVSNMDQGTQALAAEIAGDLQNAKQPLIVSGTGCANASVIQAAAQVARALSREERAANLSLVVPECNTLGLSLMTRQSLSDALQAVRERKADTVIILENDLYRREEREELDAALGNARVIAIDSLENPTTARAAVALPCAAFAEADGTFVNCEGRAQRFYRVFVPTGDIRESWRWLRDIMTAGGRPAGKNWEGLDDVIASLAATLPEFAAVPAIAPPAGFRIAGMRIAREPHRYSGRTAMSADRTVFEPKPPRDKDSPLSFSMEGFQGIPPSALMPRFWAPRWNSPQAVNKFQSEVGGPLHGGDPGKRLLEPSPSANGRFFEIIPDGFVRRPGSWLVLPAHHIFGSDELSVHSAGIAELSPAPYIGINFDESTAAGLNEKEHVELRVGNSALRFPLRHVAGLPAGTAVLPAGLPGMPHVALPAWAALAKAAPGREAGV